MRYRRLGNSGLKISEISLGSWLTYGNSVEKKQAIRTIDKAYELGINSFDTANVYAHGEAEKIVGEALNKYPRESYVLATKAFWPMGEGPNDRGLSRKHIIEQVNQSLKRLKHDYVDIFYCHRYDPETPLEETLRAIDDLIRQGKILYAGVSEWTAYQIVEGLRVQDRYLLDRLVVNQPIYNMFNRYIEDSVVPTVLENGMGLVVFSPLAQGLLTGKYRKGQAIPEDSRAADPRSNIYLKDNLTEENLEKVEQLMKIAEEVGVSLPQLALAWILHQPGITSALIGASKPEQVEENVKAVEIDLSSEILDRIEEIIG
ncbi:MAG TPA: aldo/keto reductase [Halanaerobiaceae bacterium]|jgi:voltage-dependent potassium channel beta subunit|nr:aldo/keto reductase family protein [Bacillota bacterium]HHU93274.1 aldo/keto reductase [Halanaerobiaceae bacterium]HOA40328.1 aldo/keto reductase family protein [Halanaerobiales bacterium]HPZ62304.1 aldo/keto reductase family protein [Halanaerobiales bacterium]HQD03220.1 aldo/keto reductase family protein [Halanaerobiales bacterium]